MSKRLVLTFTSAYEMVANLPDDLDRYPSQLRNAYEELTRFIIGNPNIEPESIRFKLVDDTTGETYREH